MTLGRRLAITLSLMFLAMLVGVEAIYLRSAQQHLQGQLESHAQDAATSLGLSLGIVLERGDTAVAETVINAAFDRGYYERVEFIGPEGGEPRVSRRLPVAAEEAYPAWFAAVFPLDGPTAESLVTSGWRQLGKVRVTSHPRFAYLQFWSTARNTLIWLLLIYLAALAVLRTFLASVLRPLKDVENAAEAIARREFVTVTHIPGTRELARVVMAMNTLSAKVRAALEAETERATRLQQAADYDAVSGLLNRGGFTARFNSRFSQEAESFHGTLALLKLSNLARVNEVHGDRGVDALIAAAGQSLAAALGSDMDDLAGRWAGALFVIVLSSRESADRLAAIQSAVAAAVVATGADSDGVEVHVGGVRTDSGTADLAPLFEAADAQLQVAVIGRARTPALRVIAGALASHIDERLELVRESIAAGRVSLVAQAAYAMNDTDVLHREILGRLLDGDGRQIPAAEFMPVVGRLGLSGALDQVVIQKVFAGVRATAAAQMLAVNLAPQSLLDERFLAWSAQSLRQEIPPQLALVFEISERGILQDEAAALRFAKLAAGAGVRIAIDHFGLHRDSLSLVQRLNPAYLKLSAVHTPGVLTDAGKRFFVESIVQAAAQLDVPVFAQGVEDASQIEAYRSLGVRGYQGFVSGVPAPWPDAGNKPGRPA